MRLKRLSNPCIYLTKRLNSGLSNVTYQPKPATSNMDTVKYCAKIVR